MKTNYYNRFIAWFGFSRGFALSFVYAMVFSIYALIRSSGTIINQLDANEGLFATLGANAGSMLISTLSIATVVSAATGLLGMLSALLIQWLLKKFGYSHTGLTGFFTCLSLALVLHVFIFWRTGFSWIGSSPGAYWFWFGFPTIIYIITGFVWAERFHCYDLMSQQRRAYSLET